MSSLLSDDFFLARARPVVVVNSVVEVVELVLVLVLVELVLVLVEELVVVVALVVVVVGAAVVVVAAPVTVKPVVASSPTVSWARMVAGPWTEHRVVTVALHAGGT